MSDKLHSVVLVNGEPRDVLAPVSATLLEVLRDRLELGGSKRGCNHGVCGACTVLVDGRPARACLLLAADVGERAITTIEGLSADGTMTPVQRALIDSGAIQCGFCTPGIVVALTDLFARTARPDREQIRTALSGNLCRCSGYVKIVDAAVRLAESRGLAGTAPGDAAGAGGPPAEIGEHSEPVDAAASQARV